MTRLIKRYGSRKLYDTAESRYVSLEEVAAFVRQGDEIQVLDNRTGSDATAAVLTQIISEEGRAGSTGLSAGFLHDLIRVGERTLRRGEEAVGSGLKQARQGVDEIVSRAAERIRPVNPVAEIRDEVARLRMRLESLQKSLDQLEAGSDRPESDDPGSGDGAAAPRR
ncbi:MAG: polyhydroxyalkanoate synthesis regulator DNA-binding domain-containing protein [Rubricoccaceae bacterium]